MFNLISFLAALCALIKILCLVVTTILLVISMIDGDEKRRVKEVIWGLSLLAISVMIFPLAAQIAGGSGAATVQTILGCWDPTYLTSMVTT